MDRHSPGSPMTPMSIDIRSVYQPIVALDDRAVLAYEALVRTCGEAPPIAPQTLLSAAREQNVAVDSIGDADSAR